MRRITGEGGRLLLEALQHALVAFVEDGNVGEPHFVHEIVQGQRRVEAPMDGHLTGLARGRHADGALHGAYQETLLHSHSFTYSATTTTTTTIEQQQLSSRRSRQF